MSDRSFRTERIMPKSKPSLSPEEQKALAAEAVKRMDDVHRAMASPEAREDYLDFIINFDICEVGYKTLLKSYLKSQGNTPAADNLTINPNQVPYVLKFADIKLNKKDVTTIFNKHDGKTRKHEARGMRNALSHEPTAKDLAELATRKQDYINAMHHFINAITDKA